MPPPRSLTAALNCRVSCASALRLAIGRRAVHA
jgi:hypothetical protein